MTTTKKEKIVEFNLKPGDGFEFEVLASFFLKTRNGPTQPVNIGDRVILSNETALGLLYSNWVMPAFLPSTLHIKLRTSIQHVDEAGEYEMLQPGMIISVSRAEAIPLLFKKQAELVDETLRETFARLLIK